MATESIKYLAGNTTWATFRAPTLHYPLSVLEPRAGQLLQPSRPAPLPDQMFPTPGLEPWLCHRSTATLRHSTKHQSVPKVSVTVQAGTPYQQKRAPANTSRHERLTEKGPYAEVPFSFCARDAEGCREKTAHRTAYRTTLIQQRGVSDTPPQPRLENNCFC